MSLLSKDIAIIRRALNSNLSIKNFTLQDYHHLLDALERMHLKYFLLFCKKSASDQGQARRYFYRRHLRMDHKLDREIELINLPEEKEIEL